MTILKTAARETNANQTDARFFSSVVVVVVAFGNKRGIRKSDEKIAGCGIFVKKEQEYAGSGPPSPLPVPDFNMINMIHRRKKVQEAERSSIRRQLFVWEQKVSFCATVVRFKKKIS